MSCEMSFLVCTLLTLKEITTYTLSAFPICTHFTLCVKSRARFNMPWFTQWTPSTVEGMAQSQFRLPAKGTAATAAFRKVSTMSSIFSSPSVLAVNCSTTLKPMQSRNADLRRPALSSPQSRIWRSTPISRPSRTA